MTFRQRAQSWGSLHNMVLWVPWVWVSAEVILALFAAYWVARVVFSVIL